MEARSETSLAVGYLRGFVTLLVLAFHSVLAYYPGPFPFTPLVLHMSFPVLDGERFAGARAFAAFDDIFFMSLMFLLSGLFVWPSLARKGPARFLRDRAARLGLPFLACSGLVCAIAYYPTYLQGTPVGATVAGYVLGWLRPAHWLSGPAWFIAVLLLYDGMAAALSLILPDWGLRLARIADGSARRPLRFFVIVAAVSAAAYVPLALAFGQYSWWNVGPFWLQKSRAMQYAAYFFIGAALGAYGLERGLLARAGALAQRWRIWALAALVAYVLAGVLLKNSFSRLFANLPAHAAADLGWVIACGLISFALLAAFVRFARPSRFWDSLTRNAYGMYLVHYAFCAWCQYALLTTSLAAPLKAVIVLAVVVSLSWISASALRRIPLVARII